MKTKLLKLVVYVALILGVLSCTKEDDIIQQTQNGPFEITISGEMGEFAPSTKATAESCIRMKWAAGDIIWAYDKNGTSLGYLTVSIENNNYYVAVMKGTLSNAPAEGKLYLIYSSLLSTSEQPTLSSNTLSIDMKSQTADVTPFVGYATVDGVTTGNKYETTGLKTKFSFATSVLKINATGIAKDASFTSASISDIETVCKLVITDSGFTVSGETSGLITKTLSGTASLSRASFYVGVPKFSATSSWRVLTVIAGAQNYFEHKVMQSAYSENSYVNYVYEVKTLNYIDEYGIDRGEGIYNPFTGLVWAPVNCGYEPV